MWELLALLVEGVFDLLEDVFEDGDQGSEPTDTVMPVDVVLPADVVPPADTGGNSALAAFDGGISSARWDPGPVAGPYTP